MKALINNPHRVVAIVEVLALLALVALLVITPGPAKAQSGDVYAIPQAQAAGTVYEATVVQISIKEVEASTTARVTGATVGSTLGLVLANQARTEHRFAVNALAGVLGGLSSERAANSFMRTQAQEIVVMLAPRGPQSAQLLLVVQPSPFQQLAPGEAVYVTVVGGAYRVVKRQI